MMYLIVIFIPPLYFVIRKKWGAFILNAILYFIAWLTIFFGVGIIFWVLSAGHAGWHLRKELMEENAEMIATKIAKKMKESKNDYDPS